MQLPRALDQRQAHAAAVEAGLQARHGRACVGGRQPCVCLPPAWVALQDSLHAGACSKAAGRWSRAVRMRATAVRHGVRCASMHRCERDTATHVQLLLAVQRQHEERLLARPGPKRRVLVQGHVAGRALGVLREAGGEAAGVLDEVVCTKNTGRSQFASRVAATLDLQHDWSTAPAQSRPSQGRAAKEAQGEALTPLTQRASQVSDARNEPRELCVCMRAPQAPAGSAPVKTLIMWS